MRSTAVAVCQGWVVTQQCVCHQFHITGKCEWSPYWPCVHTVKSAVNVRTVRQMLEVPNPVSYETKRFVALFTRAHYWSLSSLNILILLLLERHSVMNIELFQMACYTQILRLSSACIRRQLPSLLNIPSHPTLK